MYFISFLTGQRNYEDALRWAVYCNIRESRLPRRLLEYIRNTPNALGDAELNVRRLETRAESVREEVVELLPGYPILTIRTWSQLRALIDKFENESYIGIDSEWKPQYIAPCESVALLQIALTDAVYLVDFCSLEKELVESQWRLFLHTLLCNSSIKIGFDLVNDLRALFASPSTYSLRCVLDKISNVICLKLLVNNCSNWALRPLRISQKRYAAMDAYIVTQLFSKLKTTAESRGVDFHAVVQRSSVSGKKKEKQRSKKERMKAEEMTWAKICEKLKSVLCGSRNATDLQCIVDSMFVGLGKYLRRCGVNVLIPDNRQELKCKATESERIILTCGKAYNELKQMFPDRVLCIPNACVMTPIEQVKFVFARYTVTFSGLDVFSRCMECNSTCIVKAAGIVIKALFESVVLCRSSFHDEVFDIADWSKRLSSVDPEQYCGVGCRLIFSNDIGVVVECCGGTIDIIANIVTHDHLEEGVEVIVRRVPEQVVSRSGIVFYICASCGKVYWESDSQGL
ncbi:hypothetical protein Angca_004143 [Angiostrongylus cantonensis]|nr:hypothetical protein Angca_004143 [Angiostrongylus cantonensis]